MADAWFPSLADQQVKALRRETGGVVVLFCPESYCGKSYDYWADVLVNELLVLMTSVEAAAARWVFRAEEIPGVDPDAPAVIVSDPGDAHQTVMDLDRILNRLCSRNAPVILVLPRSDMTILADAPELWVRTLGRQLDPCG